MVRTSRKTLWACSILGEMIAGTFCGVCTWDLGEKSTGNITLLALGFFVMLVRCARLSEHQGGAQPTRLLLRKSRFDRYHAGAMSRARNRLGALVGHVKGLFALSFSPDARAAFFFSRCCSPCNPSTPQYFSIAQKKAQF